MLDSSMVSNGPSRPDINVVRVPAADMAARMNNPKSANMVMLGALLAASGLVSLEDALHALEEMTPQHRSASLEPNRKAIQEGKNSVDNT